MRHPVLRLWEERIESIKRIVVHELEMGEDAEIVLPGGTRRRVQDLVWREWLSVYLLIRKTLNRSDLPFWISAFLIDELDRTERWIGREGGDR